MGHLHWGLIGLAFGLGLVLTFALMALPVKNQVALRTAVAEATTAELLATKSDAAKKSTGQRPRKTVAGGPQKKKAVAKDAVTDKISVGEDPVTERIPIAKKRVKQKLPRAPFAPYGPGSARANADGGGPDGWLVKGRSDTRLYYTTEDPSYESTDAQVWFEDEKIAARAFFTPWRKSAQRK